MRNLKDYIGIKEAAEFLGVCEMTLRRWDEAGKFKAYRNPMNNYRLYGRSDLKALLSQIRRRRSTRRGRNKRDDNGSQK